MGDKDYKTIGLKVLQNHMALRNGGTDCHHLVVELFLAGLTDDNFVFVFGDQLGKYLSLVFSYLRSKEN